MKSIVINILLALVLSVPMTSCDDITADVVPTKFSDIRLYSDDAYIYNGGEGTMVRLDPTQNDTIQTEASISFEQPAHGSLELMEDGSTYYSPDENFIGTDQVKYTVCVGSRCLSEVYRIHVEELPDWSNCENRLEAENVVTGKNKSIAIRIHANDVMCFGDNFPVATSYASPIHGTYDMWQYSGNYKGTLYVYIPPTDFTGEDSFKYSIETKEGEKIEVTTIVTVQ